MPPLPPPLPPRPDISLLPVPAFPLRSLLLPLLLLFPLAYLLPPLPPPATGVEPARLPPARRELLRTGDMTFLLPRLAPPLSSAGESSEQMLLLEESPRLRVEKRGERESMRDGRGRNQQATFDKRT